MRWLLILALAACTGRTPVDPPVTAVLGDTIEVRLGQDIRIPSEDLRIHFDAVTEDSRCPRDVNCVWAGNARLRLQVQRAGSSEVVHVNTTVEPRAAEAAGFVIELEGLDPERMTSRPIEPSEYLAKLTVSRAR